MTPHRRLAAVALLVALPLLAGCQTLVGTEYGAQYPDLETARESRDAPRIPALVPDDPRMLRIAYDKVDEGR